jgi:hypothetical protein
MAAAAALLELASDAFVLLTRRAERADTAALADALGPLDALICDATDRSLRSATEVVAAAAL